MLDGLWAMTETFRIMALAKQLSEGEITMPFAVRGGRFGRLLPVLRDSELDELETLASWVENAESEEDRFYLAGQLEEHLQRLERRLQ